MTRGSTREYAEAVRGRYRRGSKKEKGRILDEFVKVTGYHRKAAIRVLGLGRGPLPRAGPGGTVCRRGRPGCYGSEVALALKALWEAGLEHRATHLPDQLSGGEQGRVAIARAMVNDPLLILADEPTGNLDAAARDSILRFLGSLNQRGSTILLVTHNAEAAAAARRTISLRDGRVVD